MTGLPAVIAAATAAAAGATLGFRFGFIDRERASVQFAAAQRLDRAEPFGIVAHLDKAEASRLAGIAVGHDADATDVAILFEQRSYRIFGSVEAEITHKNIFQLVFLLNLQRSESGQERTKAAGADIANRCQKSANCQTTPLW